MFFVLLAFFALMAFGTNSFVENNSHRKDIEKEARKILKTKEAVVSEDDFEIYTDFLDENNLDYTVQRIGNKVKITVIFPD